jgi:pyrroloquinoline quinone biosynthesis protein D
MSERVISDESRPRLAAHRRVRFDEQRKTWTVQAPERVFLLDDIAHAIVSRCDGERTLTQIVDDLCTTFNAPRDVVAADVQKLLQDFADKGVMET